MSSHPDCPPLDELEADLAGGLQRLGADERPVPETYQRQTQFAGAPLELSSRCFVGGPISYARMVRVDGADRAQVLNAVWVPRAATRLPIVGLELLSFVKGLHLVVLDLYPTEPDRPQAPSIDWLGQLKSTWSDRFDLEDRPDWGTEVFSRRAIILKPGARRSLGVPAVADGIRWVLGRYIQTADRAASADPDNSKVDPAASQRLDRRASYLATQAKEEPAGDFLERMTSPEWVDRFTHQFLYPVWLQQADRLPPWLGARCT